jgi:hypothetical protein
MFIPNSSLILAEMSQSTSLSKDGQFFFHSKGFGNSTSSIKIYFAEVILSLVVDHSEIAKKYGHFFDILWKTATS